MRTVILALMILALPALAEEAPQALPDAHKLARSLPEPLLEKLISGARGFSDDMARLIESYGGEQGLTTGGIDWMIASVRARARERAGRSFLAADLDGDGTLTRTEADLDIRQASESARGRLELAFRGADRDRSDAVTSQELAQWRESRANATLPEDEAALWRSVLALDLDGDGHLTLDEFESALALLQNLDLKTVREEI